MGTGSERSGATGPAASASRHRHRLVGLIAGLIVAAAAGATVGAVILLSGTYNTSATRQHFAVTHRLLEHGLRFSVAAGADGIPVHAAATTPGDIGMGAACFREHCVACHGAPGIAPLPFSLGMLPVPTSLGKAGDDWSDRELYWIISKGIRMTGMPAWEYRLSEASRWALVAFLEQLPAMAQADYRGLERQSANLACPRAEGPDDLAPEKDPDPDPRRVVIGQYGCIGCHRIAGVVGPAIDVGPPLLDWHRRRYIAGSVPNTPDNLAAWLQDPERLTPGTLMPDMGLGEQHARQIASFLLDPDAGKDGNAGT